MLKTRKYDFVCSNILFQSQSKNMNQMTISEKLTLMILINALSIKFEVLNVLYFYWFGILQRTDNIQKMLLYCILRFLFSIFFLFMSVAIFKKRITALATMYRLFVRLVIINCVGFLKETFIEFSKQLLKANLKNYNRN